MLRRRSSRAPAPSCTVMVAKPLPRDHHLTTVARTQDGAPAQTPSDQTGSRADARPAGSLSLSALDLVPLCAGSSASAALKSAGELAQSLDRAGYTRLWYAEHH